MRINLVMAMERYVLEQLQNKPGRAHCNAYNSARSQWAKSMNAMLKLYRMSPRNAADNEKELLETLEKIVVDLATASGSVEDKYGCVAAGETIVQLSRANAVLLDQPGLNVTELRQIIDPLEKKIESYTSLF